jgi:drug/metabolite transporter (DMT)-like permease
LVSIYYKLAAIACATGIALGQILFKAGAESVNESGNYLAVKPLLLFVSAFAMYFGMSIAWAYILRVVPLGQIYPYMALAFIIVPVGSYFLFDEKFTDQYFIGACLITLGIILCAKG